jgi:hypothetical protein
MNQSVSFARHIVTSSHQFVSQAHTMFVQPLVSYPELTKRSQRSDELVKTVRTRISIKNFCPLGKLAHDLFTPLIAALYNVTENQIFSKPASPVEDGQLHTNKCVHIHVYIVGSDIKPAN